jgi:hypothetical protein
VDLRNSAQVEGIRNANGRSAPDPKGRNANRGEGMPGRDGRGGFDRGLAEHRHHGIEPGLVSDPTLPALAIPVGYLINILLCHAISLF